MAEFLGHPISLPVTFESVHRRLASDTVSLKRVVVDTGAQRWQVSFRVAGGHRSGVLAALQAHRYRQGSSPFTFQCPQPQGGASAGSLSVVNPAPGGASSVVVRAVGSVVEVPAGTLFRAGGKVYMATETAQTHLSAAVPLRFHPALVAALSTADGIAFSPLVPMRVRYPPDGADSYTYAADGSQSAVVTLEEAL